MKLIKLAVSIIISSAVLTGAYALAIKATIDPSELAVGGRPLGLARAYVGMADDVYSIFQNPAGLSRGKNWQVASMYANLMQAVDYSMFGVSSSMNKESVGLAYVRAAISGSRLTKRDPITDRIVPDGDKAISYMSSVWFFTYSVEPQKYFAHPFFRNLSLGLSAKIFDQSLIGIPAGDIHGMGADMDIGMQYRPLSWLSLGAAGYNVLPYSSGGKLVWASGISESIPASGKLGASVKLLGQDGIRESVYFPQDLFMNFDHEFAFSGARPPVNHLGFEWRPIESLNVRLGLDQDPVAVGTGEVGVDTNLAAGIGYTVNDLTFDYAFHTFGSLADNNTHFISVSYGIPREKLAEVYVAPKVAHYFELTEPATKSVTFLPTVLVKGKVTVPKEVKDIRVNGISTSIFPDSSFVSVAQVPQYALNTLEVVAAGLTSRVIDSLVLTVARLVPFTDIGEDHPLRIKAGAMAALNYVTGYKDGTFKPEGNITRAELCAMIARVRPTEEAKIPAKQQFKDVPVRHWAAKYIAQEAMEKVVKGYPDKTFKPKNNITRAEAVNVLVNFAPIDKVHYIYETAFPDIEIDHWASTNIYLAKKNGFLEYLTGKKFEPNRKITRGEVVEILSKIEPVLGKFRELLE